MSTRSYWMNWYQLEVPRASDPPLPEPQRCTRTDKLWCPFRALRHGKKVCYRETQCTPVQWRGEDLGKLAKNSHLSVKALQHILPDYTRLEIESKLEELQP